MGYSHRLAGLQDPTKTFFILEMLKGYGKKGSRLDTRLPVTLPILHQILRVSSSISSTPYQGIMFKAMCAMAFFAFLRIGEITAARQSPDTLRLSQVDKLSDESGAVVSLKVTFRNFKHNYNQRPITIVINRHPGVCPVEALLAYISLRGTDEGPLFRTLDGAPVDRSAFSDLLSLAVRQCGLDPARYKGHSFRIGAASHAAEMGFSDSQIRLLGRWKSDAFKRYIRIPSLTS